MTEHHHVRPYVSATPPRLFGLVPLAEMVATYCEARWFDVGGTTTADIVGQVSAEMLEAAEDGILHALREGSVLAWAASRDGGRTIALRPEIWRTPEAMGHLLEGAVDPMRWSVPDAWATHWILVEAEGLERTIRRLFPGDDDMRVGRFGLDAVPYARATDGDGGSASDKASSDVPTSATIAGRAGDAEPGSSREVSGTMGTKPPPRRFIGIKDVTARCALSRSRIYEKMNGGTFPRPIRLGAQTTRWYEDEIDDWIAAPR